MSGLKPVDIMKVGDKVKFKEEKKRYTIRAVGKRYVVMNKPFNARKTVIYTVCDFKEKIRGTESLIFCAGAETNDQCTEMLQRLESGETEVSYRNRIPIRIDVLKKCDRINLFMMSHERSMEIKCSFE